MLEVKSLEELQSFRQANDKVVVMFTQPNCAPCRKTKPHFEAAAERLTESRFVMVDAVEAYDVFSEYGIMSTPTILVLENGSEPRAVEARTAVPMLREIESL